jgi:integrase
MPALWWYEKRQCWAADVPDVEKRGKRKRLYLGKDKSEAQSQLHRYLADYYAHRPPKRQPYERLSLLALTARFLMWCETNLAQSTAYLYRIELKPFAEKHGRRAAADITPADIEEQKTAIKKRGCKPRAINLFVQTIKRLYSWGVEQGLLKENPIRNVKRVPQAPPTDRNIQDGDIEKFLEHARKSEPLGAICEVLLHTGMRVGELLKLNWSDIDLERRLARVFEHKTAHRGEQRPRTIPLNDRVIEILQNQPKVAEVVFVGEDGQPLSYNALKCRKDRLEGKYPDMPRVTFHQFRHTFATRCARAGVPERVAQEILGHSSKLMTRYYTSTSPDELLDAVGRVCRANQKSAE